MANLTFGELLMLAIIILIIFSASRMGALGNALGRFVYSFKKASRGQELIDVSPASKQPIEDAQVIEPPKS